MSAFKYDPVNHIYTLCGEIIPGITTIIADLYGLDGIPEEVLRRKGEFGTGIHTMIMYYCQGTLDESCLSATQWKILCQFKQWEAEENIDATEAISEKPMVHLKLKYAGTPDLVFDDKIVEIKTRPYKPVDDLQCSAQHHLADNYLGKRGKENNYVLSLYEDSYEYRLCRDRQAWSKYRYMLDHYNHMKEYEGRINQWKQ